MRPCDLTATLLLGGNTVATVQSLFRCPLRSSSIITSQWSRAAIVTEGVANRSLSRGLAYLRPWPLPLPSQWTAKPAIMSPKGRRQKSREHSKEVSGITNLIVTDNIDWLQFVTIFQPNLVSCSSQPPFSFRYYFDLIILFYVAFSSRLEWLLHADLYPWRFRPMNKNKLKKNDILKLFAKIKLPKRERNDIVLDIESIIQLFADDTSMYTHLENLDI